MPVGTAPCRGESMGRHWPDGVIDMKENQPTESSASSEEPSDRSRRNDFLRKYTDSFEGGRVS